MDIVIPDEILEASQLTINELYQEIAIHFFQTHRLSLGQASQLAKMSHSAFRQLLKERRIALYDYDLDDFELDLKNLRALGRI
jgi:predicted HTH domain antitoxin